MENANSINVGLFPGQKNIEVYGRIGNKELS